MTSQYAFNRNLNKAANGKQSKNTECKFYSNLTTVSILNKNLTRIIISVHDKHGCYRFMCSENPNCQNSRRNISKETIQKYNSNNCLLEKKYLNYTFKHEKIF